MTIFDTESVTDATYCYVTNYLRIGDTVDVQEIVRLMTQADQEINDIYELSSQFVADQDTMRLTWLNKLMFRGAVRKTFLEDKFGCSDTKFLMECSYAKRWMHKLGYYKVLREISKLKSPTDFAYFDRHISAIAADKNELAQLSTSNIPDGTHHTMNIQTEPNMLQVLSQKISTLQQYVEEQDARIAELEQRLAELKNNNGSEIQNSGVVEPNNYHAQDNNIVYQEMRYIEHIVSTYSDPETGLMDVEFIHPVYGLVTCKSYHPDVHNLVWIEISYPDRNFRLAVPLSDLDIAAED